MRETIIYITLFGIFSCAVCYANLDNRILSNFFPKPKKFGVIKNDGDGSDDRHYTEDLPASQLRKRSFLSFSVPPSRRYLMRTFPRPLPKIKFYQQPKRPFPYPGGLVRRNWQPRQPNFVRNAYPYFRAPAGRYTNAFRARAVPPMARTVFLRAPTPFASGPYVPFRGSGIHVRSPYVPLRAPAVRIQAPYAPYMTSIAQARALNPFYARSRYPFVRQGGSWPQIYAAHNPGWENYRQGISFGKAIINSRIKAQQKAANIVKKLGQQVNYGRYIDARNKFKMMPQYGKKLHGRGWNINYQATNSGTGSNSHTNSNSILTAPGKTNTDSHIKVTQQTGGGMKKMIKMNTKTRKPVPLRGSKFIKPFQSQSNLSVSGNAKVSAKVSASTSATSNAASNSQASSNSANTQKTDSQPKSNGYGYGGGVGWGNGPGAWGVGGGGGYGGNGGTIPKLGSFPGFPGGLPGGFPGMPPGGFGVGQGGQSSTGGNGQGTFAGAKAASKRPVAAPKVANAGKINNITPAKQINKVYQQKQKLRKGGTRPLKQLYKGYNQNKKLPRVGVSPAKMLPKGYSKTQRYPNISKSSPKELSKGYTPKQNKGLTAHSPAKNTKNQERPIDRRFTLAKKPLYSPVYRVQYFTSRNPKTDLPTNAAWQQMKHRIISNVIESTLKG